MHKLTNVLSKWTKSINEEVQFFPDFLINIIKNQDDIHKNISFDYFFWKMHCKNFRHISDKTSLQIYSAIPKLNTELATELVSIEKLLRKELIRNPRNVFKFNKDVFFTFPISPETIKRRFSRKPQKTSRFPR